MFYFILIVSMISSSPKGAGRPKRIKNIKLPKKAEKVIILRQLHTKEILPLGNPTKLTILKFLRCRVTAQLGPMDLKLIKLIKKVAKHFKTKEVKIVSAFRAPRFNEELRKKLHQVAPRSMHTQGKAIDFTITGVDPLLIAKFLRKRRTGGVGYYKTSKFIHMDTGPVRSWSGK